MTSDAMTTTVPGGAAADEAGDVGGILRYRGWRRRLGFGLVVLSCLLYGCLLLVPSAPLSTAGKVALSSMLVISGEVSFWIGGFILGREAIRRWRGALDPRRWIRGRG